ncbi:BMC domain-containing protein [Desulfopila sp. IMCC35008]|uniref:BMC domain-containing protein n=1 Tax=Desulfopila sp. IMCC35008 TaxID=2653858 RepID=UPI0013D0E68E|nr:BMC domain-containing protein [Desulfopila sp. IMCC35008]
MMSLGFIETKGLLAAIEAADAMVKAADVCLVEKNTVGGGLVTITVAGEVSAVRASVDAAISAISRIEGAELVSGHVIARPYEEIARIIATKEPTAEPECLLVEESPVDTDSSDTKQSAAGRSIQADDEDVPRYTISELKKTTVSKLRQIASALIDLPLTSEEIRTATKKKLIEAILNVTDRGANK